MLGVQFSSLEDVVEIIEHLLLEKVFHFNQKHLLSSLLAQILLNQRGLILHEHAESILLTVQTQLLEVITLLEQVQELVELSDNRQIVHEENVFVEAAQFLFLEFLLFLDESLVVEETQKHLIHIVRVEGVIVVEFLLVVRVAIGIHQGECLVFLIVVYFLLSHLIQGVDDCLQNSLEE